MPGKYRVEQGDCISSIVQEHGLFWEEIWNHPGNTELRRKRKDPNLLLPGDMVFLPDKEVKEVPASVETRHRFRRKGVPAYLRLRLVDTEEEPRRNLRYVLNIDGNLHSGTTDEQGHIDQTIAPNARKAILTIIAEDEGAENEEYEILLGHVDPISEASGVDQRLRNLGYLVNSPDEDPDEARRQALMAFQARRQSEQTGECDDATRQQLENFHSS